MNRRKILEYIACAVGAVGIPIRAKADKAGHDSLSLTIRLDRDFTYQDSSTLKITGAYCDEHRMDVVNLARLLLQFAREEKELVNSEELIVIANTIIPYLNVHVDENTKMVYLDDGKLGFSIPTGVAY